METNFSLEKINLSKSLTYWKANFDLSKINDYVNNAIDIESKAGSENGANLVATHNSLDEFNQWIVDNNSKSISELCKLGIDICKEIYEYQWNTIETDFWINIIKTKNPIQRFKVSENSNKKVYHNHTELNKQIDRIPPQYTFVFYLQMPNNLKNDDGTLYLMDSNSREYNILPKEGDVIILDGNCWHSPQGAPDSTKDRIVLAGNVFFDNRKKDKNLF